MDLLRVGQSLEHPLAVTLNGASVFEIERIDAPGKARQAGESGAS